MGSAGGKATLKKYGLAHFHEIGKLGGRPRWQPPVKKDKTVIRNANGKLTLAEMKQIFRERKEEAW